MVKLLFENVPCPRCGGSGRYSYCTMFGSRCFKCGGDGAVLTKRGRVAQAYLIERRKVRADQLKVGDQVMEGAVPYAMAGGWAKVLETGFRETANGTAFVVITEKCQHYTTPDAGFRLRRSNAEARVLINEALEYQARLNKQGKEAKRKKGGKHEVKTGNQVDRSLQAH